MSLSNRVAIVTGGSSGIGRSIAIEFAREGARVVVADLREVPRPGRNHDTDVTTPTVSEIEQIGGEGLFVQTDVAIDSQVINLIERTEEHFGALDILVNNAGIYIPGNSQELSMEDWQRVTNVNYRGLYVISKYSVELLKRSSAGRIINIASIQAFHGGGGPAYAAGKAGVVNLTRDMAVELGPHGITVNVVCPGYIETPIQDYWTPEQIEEFRANIPLRRLGKSRDIGRACVFLASSDAEWITGTALPIDGGALAKM